MKKQATKEKVDATTVEVMNLVKATIENDPNKQLISFMREEVGKFREHEFKLFQLMLFQRENGMIQILWRTMHDRVVAQTWSQNHLLKLIIRVDSNMY